MKDFWIVENFSYILPFGIDISGIENGNMDFDERIQADHTYMGYSYMDKEVVVWLDGRR